jgi:hypothetical protein
MRPRVFLSAALFCAALSADASWVTPQTAPTAGGTLVYITLDYPCAAGNCTPIVQFDGIPSSDVKIEGINHLTAVVPPHAKEAVVKVEVITPYSRETIVAPFAYVDPRDEVLVPFTFRSAPGFGGSRWSTELWVHNEADHDVSLTPKICGGLLGLHECEVAPLIVAAKSSLLVPTAQTFYFMVPGTYYSIPRADAAQLAFDLRLVDETHPETSATSIPVVRVQPRSKVVLLNVPNDGHGRMLLRVYGFQETFAAHVYDLDSGERLADELLAYYPPTDVGGGTTYPGFAAQSSAIFDVPAVRKARRLRVEIESVHPEFPTFVWAIITITDNVTQHVTVITPAS